jgi:hypothetical protein
LKEQKDQLLAQNQQLGKQIELLAIKVEPIASEHQRDGKSPGKKGRQTDGGQLAGVHSES